MRDLQGTMGNTFVSRVSTGGVPTAPEAIPAAPEAEDDWWQSGGGSDSATEPTPAATSASPEAEAEEGTGYGTRQPDEEDAGSQYTSGSGGGGGTNEVATEDTPGGADAAYTDEAESAEAAGGDAGAAYTTGNNYGEIEAGPQDMEKEKDDSSWWPFSDDDSEEEPAAAGSDSGSWWDDIFGGSDAPDVDPGSDDGPTSEKDPSEATQEEVEAEQETTTERETYTGEGGGPPVISPAATATSGASMGSGFVAGGRIGTVPVHSVFQCNFNERPGGYPHAWVGGGKTGPTPWAGGGGAGPKGNQESGSIQNMVVPDYSSHGNLWNNADAYVEPGTGITDVKRDYITSNAGDQGNGWYVTPAAAARLEVHEQTHVSTAMSNYNAYLDPMQKRVADSEALGKGKTFYRSDAKTLLRRMIGWKDAIDAFQEHDKADNGKNGNVDDNDMHNSGWPRNIGPGDLNGVHYENRLIMNSERDPAVVGTPVDAPPKPTTP